MIKKGRANKVYKRGDSPVYYLDYTDPLTGKRIRRSSGKSSKEEAERELTIALGTTATNIKSYTLSQIMVLYENPETNPRKKQARMDGTTYGDAYAKSFAMRVKRLRKFMQVNCPRFLELRVSRLKRTDLKTIKEILVDKLGQKRSSQQYFQAIKIMISQCVEDGIIEVSVGAGLKDIHYEEKRRYAIAPEIIRSIINARDSFPSDEEWAFFTVLATTGMRASEVLALASFQIANGVLTVNRALKSHNKDDIGLPKWNITRVIPLSSLTQEALEAITPDEYGRYFHHNRCWAVSAFNRIQGMISILSPDTKKITAHILRHSLNSNLLALGLSPVLVAEYLSWSHQNMLDIQERYTHILAKHMLPIADAIDSLYGKDGILLYTPENSALQM